MERERTRERRGERRRERAREYPYLASKFAPHLLADTLCNRHGSNAPGLRTANDAKRCVTFFHHVLCELRGFPRPCLTHDDDDLIVSDHLQQGNGRYDEMDTDTRSARQQ